MSTKFLRVSLLVMGLSGIVAQILFLRELLVSFLGNELTLGIILANWLLLEAIGSFTIGRSVKRREKRLEVYVSLQLIFSIALPAAIYLSRTFKVILSTIPGEAIGLGPIFTASFLIMLPVALSHGALFTIGCQLSSEGLEGDPSPIGRVYGLETIGMMAGGFLLSFILIQHLNSFEIAFVASLINAFISVLLLSPKKEAPSSSLRRGLWGLSLLLSLLYTFLLFSPGSRALQATSIRSQWRGLEVVHNENSIYGNITVTKNGEQYTFFYDGIPSMTTPVPDIAAIEDVVHFPMLFHEKPQTILVLSGGAGGMIHEILKYPVTQVDYVELDPLLLKLVQRFQTPLTQSELADPRVRIHYSDGRLFLRKTQSLYDIIFIGLSAPHELQSNRLFTSEFFSMAKRKLNPGGIIVLTLPGSLTYLSPELRDLNRCILETLRDVYRHVRIIPGDVNLYLSSDSDPLGKITLQEIVKRYEERRIRTGLLTKGYIEDRLQERWSQWLSKSLEAGAVHRNSDFRPLGVFYHLSYWNALFSPYIATIFKWSEGFSLTLIFALVALLTFFAAILFFRKPSFSRQALPYSIFTTGVTGMVLELTIIFTFQTLYGYLYHQIGLLVTLFMGGVACSSLYITHRLERIRKGTVLFLGTELAIILFSILLPFAFSMLSRSMEKGTLDALVYGIFLAISFLSGLLIGAQFPLGAKIYLNLPSKTAGLGQTAGLLYGSDLLGGFFGGLWGGILLLPILGLKESCLLVATIKFSSFLLFLLFTKVHGAPRAKPVVPP